MATESHLGRWQYGLNIDSMTGRRISWVNVARTFNIHNHMCQRGDLILPSARPNQLPLKDLTLTHGSDDAEACPEC